MNSKKNSKCIVVSNKVLIFAVLKDKRINYIIKHLKIIVMKEVNFYCQNSKLNRTIAVKYVAEYYQKSDMKIFTANTTLFEKFLNRCALNHDEKI